MAIPTWVGQPSMTTGGVFETPAGLWLASVNRSGAPLVFYSSSDLGMTWTTHSAPSDINTYSVSINSIRFFDSLNGVMECTGAYAQITSDGGRTWTGINGGFSDGAFLQSIYKIVVAGGSFVSIMQYPFSSANHTRLFAGGGSRTFLITPKGTVFAGHDPVQMSTDFGNSWQPRTGRYSEDAWSMAIGPLCDSTIYIESESGLTYPYPGGGEMSISSDGANSFTTVLPRTDFGFYTGCLVTSKHAAFCATKDGVLRSTDKGTTWINIGGPGGNFIDVRSIAAINDSLLFAVDPNGTVWMTPNGGGHHFTPPPPPMPQITMAPAKATSCDSGKASASLMHTYCDALTVTSAALQGTDASYFTLAPQTLPVSLGNGAKINFSLGFNPKKEVRTFAAGIRVKGFYLFEYEDTIYIDTIITINGTSTPVPPNFVAPRLAFTYDTVSTCAGPIDTTVLFINKGCDTLTITQGPGILPPEFKMTSVLNLPIKLAPGDSLRVTFSFFPSGTGRYTANPKFTAVQQGLSQDVTLYLEGSGKSEGGVFSYSPKQFDFQSLSICDHDSASGFVTNVGCDSLLLDPAVIFSDPDFKLTANSLQPTVKPGDTYFYKVYLDPAQKGLRQGKLIFISHTNLGAKADTILFTATVTDGTRILSATESSVDFGSVSVCDEKDTIVHLVNSGCDTLVVVGVGLKGVGFGTGTKFPIIILPNHDTTIHIFTLLDT
ncbi:MAG: hypothetical protein ABI778_06575, partial [Ignavibacteriota bacterium]